MTAPLGLDEMFPAPDDGADHSQEAADAIVGSQPEPPQPVTSSVELALGVRYNGAWHTNATVRELNGEDEEVLSRTLRDTDSANDFVTDVAALSVVSVGSYDISDLPISERRTVIKGLLLGDGESIFLAAVRSTYGDTREFTYGCGACAVKNTFTVSITNDMLKTHHQGPEHYIGQEFTTSRGDVLTYSLPTGFTREEALSGGATSGLANTKVIAAALQNVNNHPHMDPEGYARALGIKDRQLLLGKLAEQPRPELSFIMDCASCGHKETVEVSLVDTFRL